MKVVFFGTPTFATPFLQALIDDPDTKVVAVVSQPDKPKGRKQLLQATPTKVVAQEHSIPVLQFPTLKSPDAEKTLKEQDADVFVVVAYGKMVPKTIIDIPTFHIVNVHPSLLPRHRGPSPMQWSISEGDRDSGVSVMLIDEGMDTGPLLAQESFTLSDKDTYESLERRVHDTAPQLLVTTLKQYLNGDISPTPQSADGVTITRLLNRDDGHIDWSLSATNIDRLVRAYQPWPGTWSMLQKDQRIKILSSSPAPACSNVAPGTLHAYDESLHVTTKDGCLHVSEMQVEGKQKTSGKEFLLGYPDALGNILT